MFKLNKEQGILEGENVRQVTSPNYNERPLNTDIDLLVIHSISLPPGEFGGPYIDALFTNTLDWNAHPYFQEIKDLQVSCHCFINRFGQLTQYVPFSKRAWHAGESQFQDKENCNDYGIGIELEGTDVVAYTEEQYQTLSYVIVLLQAAYPGITEERIVGHDTIAPERKTDPGPAFDWRYLSKLTHTYLENKSIYEQYS
jgi:AmpD protein